MTDEIMIIETLLSFINTIFPFLIILTILVFVHELGHYLVAIYNGVKVEVFSIGFGKEIFGFNDKKGTRWKFSLIPLGGYVKMHGDADEASSKEIEDNDVNKIDEKFSFHKKSVGARSAILFAGPLANFLFSFFLLAFINSWYGFNFNKPIISEIVKGKPAEISGLIVGDTIVKVNNIEIETFEDIKNNIGNLNNEIVRFVINRNDKLLDFEINVQNGLIGIKGGETFRKKLSIHESFVKSYEQIFYFTKATLIGIYEIFKGERSSDELGGPIRIAELSSDFWEKGIYSTLWFMVLISLNLGLINLFPIPLLDGGHLLFNGIEILKGSPVDKKFMHYFNSFGFILLISLMLFATYNDISRFL